MMLPEGMEVKREKLLYQEKIFDKHLIALLFWANRCGRTKGGSRVLGT
jgi:hypothetical protein